MAAVKASEARGDPPLLRAVEVARLVAWVLEPVMTTTAAGAESSSSSSSAAAARAVLPVGFRFRPTDEELVRHYLMAKIAGRPYPDLLAIPDVDLAAVEPWDLPARSVIKSDDPEWFFFARRDRPKYPGKSSRSCRSIAAGYWKATGKDPLIRPPGPGGCRGKGALIGVKKTLIFHRGRTPRGARTPWIMHEYTATTDPQSQSQSQSAAGPQNDFQDRGGRGHGTLRFFCVDTFVTDALLCYISTGIYENACRLKGGAASAFPLVHLFVNSILLLLLLFEARCYPHSQGALLSRMSGGVSSVVVLKATDVTTAVYDIDHKLSG